MSLKGQSSVELTMVVGIVLLLSSPFIFASQSSIIELQDASDFLELDRSIEELRSAALELNSSSYPARRVVEFKTPRDLEAVYNPDLSTGSAVVFNLDAGGNSINRSIVLDMELNLTEKGNITSKGLHDVLLKRDEGQVNISVVS
jgi:hypothetical protein